MRQYEKYFTVLHYYAIAMRVFILLLCSLRVLQEEEKNWFAFHLIIFSFCSPHGARVFYIIINRIPRTRLVLCIMLRSTFNSE